MGHPGLEPGTLGLKATLTSAVESRSVHDGPPEQVVQPSSGTPLDGTGRVGRPNVGECWVDRVIRARGRIVETVDADLRLAMRS